ncbi:MAG TPA: class I SAM-dependent methyltransferase, partial [Cyanobacteria bacterium UBA11049]|nr:class I SAM-dependent methyltransferase [Cyanobacteria bacterium UBA11049]
MNELASKWPKRLPELTDEQQRIRDDFMNHWLQILPKRYGILERFNHSYPLRTQHSKIKRTLDIGAGRGEHLNYEDISSQDYTAMELRPELAEVIRLAYPSVKVVVGDCQERI